MVKHHPVGRWSLHGLLSLSSQVNPWSKGCWWTICRALGRDCRQRWELRDLSVESPRSMKGKGQERHREHARRGQTRPPSLARTPGEYRLWGVAKCQKKRWRYGYGLTGQGLLKPKGLQVTGTPVLPRLGTKRQRHTSPPKSPHRGPNYEVTVPPDQAHHLTPKGEESRLKPDKAIWTQN